MRALIGLVTRRVLGGDLETISLIRTGYLKQAQYEEKRRLRCLAEPLRSHRVLTAIHPVFDEPLRYTICSTEIEEYKKLKRFRKLLSSAVCATGSSPSKATCYFHTWVDLPADENGPPGGLFTR